MPVQPPGSCQRVNSSLEHVTLACDVSMAGCLSSARLGHIVQAYAHSKMKSSFVRKGTTSTADVGTRPGLHGQTLISTGWVDWDKLLGGGLPLGTVTLLIEDCHSQQHLNFLRYFLAESVLTGQRALWFSPKPPKGGAAAFLPAVSSNEPSSSSSKASSGTAAEEEGELRIAWQYRKYIQGAQQQQQATAAAAAKPSARPSSSSSTAGGKTATQKVVDAGISRQWCHTYDLSRSMELELVEKHGLVCQTCSGSGALTQMLQQCQEFISTFACASTTTSAMGIPVPVRGNQPAGRVVLQSLLAPSWSAMPPGEDQPEAAQPGHDVWQEQLQQLGRLLYGLRLTVQDTRCAVLVTLQADMLPESWLLRYQHLCHAVLSLSSITDASQVYKLLPDPTSAAALLSVGRLPSAGMLGPRITEHHLYVVRHKRKRLTLTQVEVDPDAEAAQQQALASAASQVGGLAGLAAKRDEGGAGEKVVKQPKGLGQAAKGFDF